MESLKTFLTTEIPAIECGITRKDISLLKKYKTISVGGKTYSTADILKRIHSCETCRQMKIKIDALEIELKKNKVKPPPPVKILMRNYFQKHYEKTSVRGYSRKTLFHEITTFLSKEYNIRILHSSDVRWRWFIKEVVKDSSKNYKKLQIKKKSVKK
jgi:hypothetical protein